MIYKIIVDKQSSTNPSSEKREYTIDIEELRVKGDVYDSLVITKDEDYVMRRLSLSELQVLTVLEEPIKQTIPNLNIELFEGDNYIYLLDMTGNKFYAEYIVKNDFTDIYVTTNEMNSAINQSASQIELTVNQKLTGYSTTKEMNSAIDMKVDSIETSVNEKLKDYDTSTEVNSKITQKADEITSTVSKTYATKNELSTAKSEIKQTTDSISSTVSKKVGKDEIISKINQTAEDITIDASRININGAVSANGNFKVDTKGNMTCKNGAFTGGTIELSSNATSYNNAKFKINSSDGSQGFISSRSISLYDGSSSGIPAQLDISIYDGDSPRISLIGYDLSSSTDISSEGIITPTLEQTSKESSKKNFEKLDSGLDILKDIDIYKYNLKNEEDTTKKHIGFVIGDNYNYSEEVTSNNNDGVDIYSFVAVCCKAIQEQQVQIENQNNLIQSLIERIEKLEAK